MNAALVGLARGLARVGLAPTLRSVQPTAIQPIATRARFHNQSHQDQLENFARYHVLSTEIGRDGCFHDLGRSYRKYAGEAENSLRMNMFEGSDYDKSHLNAIMEQVEAGTAHHITRAAAFWTIATRSEDPERFYVDPPRIFIDPTETESWCARLALFVKHGYPVAIAHEAVVRARLDRTDAAMGRYYCMRDTIFAIEMLSNFRYKTIQSEEYKRSHERIYAHIEGNVN